MPETALLREPMRPEHLRHRHDWLCGERVVRTYAFVYQGRPGGPGIFSKMPTCVHCTGAPPLARWLLILLHVFACRIAVPE